MNISEKREIAGKHNGYEFTWEMGILCMYQENWGKEKIKALIEVANLLEVEGFKLVDELPKKLKSDGMFDSPWTLDCSTDEEAE